MIRIFIEKSASAIRPFLAEWLTYLAQTPEIGQGIGRFLSCGARKQEQT